jgi:hypothetical protein
MAGYMPTVPLTLHCPDKPWVFQAAESYVQIPAQDRADRLDLRFVVGLPVLVIGESEGRVMAVCEAVKDAKPKGVIGIVNECPRITVEGLMFAHGDMDWIKSWPKENGAYHF